MHTSARPYGFPGDHSTWCPAGPDPEHRPGDDSPNGSSRCSVRPQLATTIQPSVGVDVGLSLSTRIGPAAFRNLTVALFYLTISPGSALSGTLAGFYSPGKGTYFGITGAAAIVLGLVLFALSPWIRRAMRGVR